MPIGRLVVAEDPLEHVVVINLEDDRGKGRREHMIQQFQKVPWSWILFGFAFEVEKHSGNRWVVFPSPYKMVDNWNVNLKISNLGDGWWFLHGGFLWIAWRLIWTFMGREIPILEVINWRSGLFPQKNYLGVWDMLPKLLVGSVVCLVDWLVSFMRGLIVHPKTNSLQPKLFVSSCLLAFSAILSPSQLRKIIQETLRVDVCCLVKSCRHKSPKLLILLAVDCQFW